MIALLSSHFFAIIGLVLVVENMKVNALNIGLTFLVAGCCFFNFFWHHGFINLILGILWLAIGLLEVIIFKRRRKK